MLSVPLRLKIISPEFPPLSLRRLCAPSVPSVSLWLISLSSATSRWRLRPGGGVGTTVGFRVLMEFDLKRLLLALLFSSSDPLSIKDVQGVITRFHEEAEAEAKAAALLEEEATGALAVQGVFQEVLAEVPSLLTATQIREALEALQTQLAERDETVRLIAGPEGWRLTVAPGYADWVRLLRREPKPQRLSPAQLETLAVIAYRQPVTRSELEAIRGVSADGALSRLLDQEMIVVAGRADLPGRPLQYGTTAKFLDWVGLKSVDELPASDVLSPAQLSEWVRQATQPTTQVTELELGLPVDDEHAVRPDPATT